MTRDGKAARRAPAAREAFTRQPDPPPDGDGRLPPTSPSLRDPMPYTYTTDLAAIRAIVHRYAVLAGLTEARAIDLVLAVNEVAANTVRHAKSPGSLKIWYDSEEIVCQIHDEGRITDPLAGSRPPSLTGTGGHGLWIVQRVCDQVEIHSDETGTTIRLHMELPRLKLRS
jgi:anti-sigma regulatory factor (Ser/Thr protein kinase)